MKIAIVCYPTFGGSGVVATELGIELAHRGHEIHFLFLKSEFTKITSICYLFIIYLKRDKQSIRQLVCVIHFQFLYYFLLKLLLIRLLSKKLLNQ